MEPEVIVKLRTYEDLAGSTPRRLPEILLLGNQAGLRAFAKAILKYADQAVGALSNCDPEDHAHITMKWPPFNQPLSDELEFRLGIINESNRAVVLARYGLDVQAE